LLDPSPTANSVSPIAAEAARQPIRYGSGARENIPEKAFSGFLLRRKQHPALKDRRVRPCWAAHQAIRYGWVYLASNMKEKVYWSGVIVCAMLMLYLFIGLYTIRR